MLDNKKKHLDLLKYKQDLETQGKHISHESRKDFLELRKYSIMMTNHLHWKNRNQYLELIEQFLNGPLDLLSFDKKYPLIDDASSRLQADFILLEHFSDICLPYYLTLVDLSIVKIKIILEILEAEILETGISRTKFGGLMEDIFGECEFYEKDISDKFICIYIYTYKFNLF